MSLAKYIDTTDSGVEWLGEVPLHWSVVRLRHVAELNPTKSEVSDLDRELPVSFLPMEAVGDDGTIQLEHTRSIGAVENGYTYFREGDVTVAKITPCFENGKGAIMRGLLNGIGFGTTELIVVRPRSEYTTSDFLHWLFMSSYFRRLGESTMYGAGGQKRVPDAFVRNFATAIPPLDEQKAIAAFLDVETAKIDGLVSEQRRLIDLLKEKRQAVISHAVTKGLNPNAPMKPSGIQWLGDVPQHWRVSRIKYECVYESGHTPSKSVDEYWIEDDCHIPWVSLNDTKAIDASDFIDDTKTRISEVGMANSSAHLIDAGAVVFTRDGARVGLSAITTRPMCVSQHIIAWVCGPTVSNHFLLHVIYSMNAEIYRITAGSTIPTIGMPDVKRMSMPLPPIGEQLAIVDFLVAERERFATLIGDAERAIELLQERRTALISAAVTGKIDVRGVVAGSGK